MFCLCYLQDGVLRKVPLGSAALTIGRGRQCGLRLTGRNISRHHCRVQLDEEQLLITDLKSRNGTWIASQSIGRARLDLDGSFVIGDTPVYFKEGDDREFKISPELSMILADIPEKPDRRSNPETVTDLHGDRLDLLLRTLAALAWRESSTKRFIQQARPLLEQVLPEGGIYCLWQEECLVLDHRLPVTLEALGLTRRSFTRSAGQFEQDGQLCHYRLFRPAAGPAGLTLIQLSLIPPAGQTGQFYQALLGVMEIQLQLAPGAPAGHWRHFPPLYEDESLAIIGRSDALRQVVDLARRIAPRSGFALIYGESGTGKELIARMIHRLSGRREYVAINCAAIPANLLESELFGHERGAFTDARQAKTGLIELSSGGTLVLDEIADMPPELQAKLLRVIQEQKVYRVGGHRETPVDLRIIAMTNRDLPRRVEQGLFRRDLFFRLRVHELTVPPLRERREDIFLLIQYYTRRFGEQNRIRQAGFSQAARDVLLQYDWPGNVRELENQIRHVMEIIDDGELIGRHHLLPELWSAPAPSGSPAPPAKVSRAPVSRETVMELLQKNQFNKSRTARELHMTYRGLLKMLQRLGISSPPD